MIDSTTLVKRSSLVLMAAGIMAGSLQAQESPAYAMGETAPWMQEAPGYDAYLSARGLLNQGSNREAAQAFARLREEFPRSPLAAEAYYYEAFALSRTNTRADLRRARALLATQLEEHPGAGTTADARELMVRVESMLARLGDASAAASVTQQAQEVCGPESEQEMKAAALNALLNMNPERAVPILRRVLEDKDQCSAELREQAVFLIAQHLSEESVDILLDLAHRNPDPDPDVREQAVFWLSQVETEEAIDALLDILMESGDPEIQENALFAISQHSSDRSMDILREFAERGDLEPEIRENALFWIGQSPGGAQYLKSLWGTLREAELKENILHAIAQHEGQENQDWLIARAMDPNEDQEVRSTAIFWAGQHGAFTVAQLRQLFSSFDDPELKEQVLFVASQREETEAVDFLMEVAENKENGELRETAIFWLGQSDDPRVPEFLLRIIG